MSTMQCSKAPNCKSPCWRWRDTRFDIPQMNKRMRRSKMKHETNLTLKHKVQNNFKNPNPKIYHCQVYAYKGTWVFGKCLFLYLPHGSGMGIYKNYIPVKGMRQGCKTQINLGWGRIVEKFTSAGSRYVYPGWYPMGVWRFFWYLPAYLLLLTLSTV